MANRKKPSSAAAMMMISSVGDANAMANLYEESAGSGSITTNTNSNDNAPYTIFCKACRTILGDSTSVVANVKALKAISLAHVKDVTVDEEARTAPKGGEDEISIYRDISCNQCKLVIGRKYLAIPKYEEVQDTFSFCTDRVGLYYHGSTIPPADVKPNVEIHRISAPADFQVMQDIASLKRFCLMLSDNQDSLTAQVAQLNGIPGASILSPHKTNSSSKQSNDLKEKLQALERSLQGVIENQNTLLHQIKRETSGRASMTDFTIEIPPINKPTPIIPAGIGHLSPPPSMPSQEATEEGETTINVEDETFHTESIEEIKKKGKGKKGSKVAEPVIILSEEEGDDEEYIDDSVSHKSKRTRLNSKRSWNKRSARASTGSIVPESVLNTPDPQDQVTPTARVTRSKK